MSKRYLGGVITANAVTPTGSFQDSAAPGMWTSAQQLQLKAAGLWPLFGNVNPNQFIENLFSTYLYTGNGSTQTITNGIDLAGKGGLVWIKSRTNAASHYLTDSASGVGNYLSSNTTNQQNVFGAQTDDLTAFNSNGFSLGSDAGLQRVNTSPNTYASWTFRKQPKFFDVVTWTGNDITRSIPHNLGSVPGCMIIKATNSAKDWYVYHRGIDAVAPEDYYTVLNTTAARVLNGNLWDAPTSTNIVLNTGGGVNQSGVTYVAYLFAHNAGGFGLSGNENVVSCGSYTGNGSSTGPVVTLGYEPQWVMIKNSSAVGNWTMLDIMRGMPVGGGSNYLRANTSVAEGGGAYPTAISATGFQIVNTGNSDVNADGNTYIYIAIRRGPMAVPTLGTTVYNAVARTGTSSAATVTAGFPVDLIMSGVRNKAYGTKTWDRLRGITNPLLYNNATNAEYFGSSDSITAGTQTGITVGADSDWTINNSGDTYVNWFFRRAPSFFDEVCWSGISGSRALTHNLAAVPELMIAKNRTDVGSWIVYTATTGASQQLRLNNNDIAFFSQDWDLTSPTASVFSVGNTLNGSGQNYVAYLFSTCAGVSKVGSYTGTGTTQAIACGFTTGARYVLIKRTDSTGDWYVWDSARGIVAGNDPYLLLNSTAAEVTGTDYIDTSAAGFEISSTAPAAINASGGSYIFLAIS